jgi:hypothetical protein
MKETWKTKLKAESESLRSHGWDSLNKSNEIDAAIQRGRRWKEFRGKPGVYALKRIESDRIAIGIYNKNNGWTILHGDVETAWRPFLVWTR